MLIGYARVSTDEQDTRLQIDALKRAGCEKIYEERASGSRTDRPELKFARPLMRDKSEHWTWPAVAARLAVSHMTLWRAMKRHQNDLTAVVKSATTSSPSRTTRAKGRRSVRKKR